MWTRKALIVECCCVLGVAIAVGVWTLPPAVANKCPEDKRGYVLWHSDARWKFEGGSHSIHSPNDHGDNPHVGITSFDVYAIQTDIDHDYWCYWHGFNDTWSGQCIGEADPVNEKSFTVTLTTPFFNGKAAMKATSPEVGTMGNSPRYSAYVSLAHGWLAMRLLNADGTFKIECPGTPVSTEKRTDPYHDIDASTSTLMVMQTLWGPLLTTTGSIWGCETIPMEDTRFGSPKLHRDEEGNPVLDESGVPTLDLDEDGAIQWRVMPHVTTRLSSSVASNGDGTVTYTYLLENLTADAIPFSVAQVPVSATQTGWTGTVSGNSSVQTTLTVDSGDICRENASLELKVDGAPDFNEAVGGQIYVPSNRGEFRGTCVINSVTHSLVPNTNHVTILLSGDGAQDIYVFRQTATGATCVGEMHGDYVAGQEYTVDADDPPSGTVSYYVSVGKGVNKYNSAAEETINP